MPEVPDEDSRSLVRLRPTKNCPSNRNSRSKGFRLDFRILGIGVSSLILRNWVCDLIYGYSATPIHGASSQHQK